MSMINPANAAVLFLLLSRGCSTPYDDVAKPLKHNAAGKSPEILALYEAWFGHPKHISIGYSSHEPAVIDDQIRKAKAMGISAFVVDWYGDREPFIDRSYALMQAAAKKENFHVAMMYDETEEEDNATDEALADFTMFHDTYLSSNAPGHEQYLNYEGRPMIFIFPTGKHTDWERVRAMVDKWSVPPLLIFEIFQASMRTRLTDSTHGSSRERKGGQRMAAIAENSTWMISIRRCVPNASARLLWVVNGPVSTTVKHPGD